MAEKFMATVRRMASDSDGESRIEFAVPACHYDDVAKVGKMVARNIVVIVMEEHELAEKTA